MKFFMVSSCLRISAKEITVDSNQRITCKQCGTCCLAHISAYASGEDIERWNREGRDDILHIIEHEHAMWVGDHLVSSLDGHYLHGCPFLTWEGAHYACSIYVTRPSVCRNYEPGSSEICPQFKRTEK